MTPTLKERIRPYYLKWLYFRLREANKPALFSRCWKYPERSAEELSRLAPCAGDVVFLPMADWHAGMQRSQHLATGLARMGYRCLYASPHLGREFPRPYPLSRREVVTQLDERVFELHVHLPNEPVFHHRRLTPDEARRVALAVIAYLEAAGSQARTLVVSFPVWLPVAEILKREAGCTVLADCHDLLSGFGNIDSALLHDERRLMQTADAVFFSSQWLKDYYEASIPELRGKSVVLRNACNPEDFRRSRGPARGPGKVIGYIGSLNSWFDAEAVALAAERHPEWEFRMVGWAVSRDLEKLRALPNVKFTGEVSYTELPQHLDGFDVATIPFRLEDLTLATNPVKLYEYFAAGVPVVSTRLPEVELYRDLVYLADGADDFVLKLEHAVAEEDNGKLEARREVAARESWQSRCRVLREHLQR